MLHPADLQASSHDRDQEVDPWPLLIALAVIGPFAIALALAVLVAVAS